MDNLLYFPYISIPETPWLYKSLLYWDTIDTITPEQFLRNPKLFENDYMAELLEAELVRPIMPMNYIYDIPDFQEDFLAYVDSRFKNKEDMHKRRDHDDSRSWLGGTKIHLEKMAGLGYKLVDRDLAVQEGSWFYMKQSIANDFMFYLAVLIGKQINSQPITNTDSKSYLGKTFPIEIQKQKVFMDREGLRRTVINNIFPTPIAINNVNDLYNFKQRNEEQLKDFRKYIERELLNIDVAPEHLKDERLQNLIKDVEDEKMSISEKMKEKWNVFDSATLVQMTASAFTMTNAVKTGTDLAITSAALSIISTAITSMKKMQKNHKDIMASPLAYAFLVEEKWGFNQMEMGDNLGLFNK